MDKKKCTKDSLENIHIRRGGSEYLIIYEIIEWTNDNCMDGCRAITTNELL